ncbi:MAG: LysE family translocator [Chloroflexota bacterium]|nr:LysE family translocator [Chloroflexota bacterium]
MPSPSTLAVFLLAGVVLVVVPGPNIVYIVTRGAHQGRVAGLVSALGVEVGTLVHAAAAALGLSALLASSATAFTAVKYAGAAYLIWLGVRTLLAKDAVDHLIAPPPASRCAIFWQGVTVNVLNPKTALFFLAFLPQFVDPTRGSAGLQILILGVLLTALGLASDCVYALLAGGVGGILKRSARFRAGERWVVGTTYLGLGAATAVADVSPGGRSAR